MEIKQLLSKAVNGDTAAVRELTRLQRDGKAMRLYPHGRRGPLDEGMAPLEILATDDYMIRFTLGHYSPIVFKKPQLASVMLYAMQVGVVMARHYGDDYNELESHVTPGLGCLSSIVSGDSIVLTFQPPGLLEYDLGLYHTRKLLDNWTVLIEQNEWDHEDCGFTDNEYCDVLLFSDFNSEL